MPSRNVIKIDVPDSYYHVYARGHGRQKIFRDEQDFAKFMDLFERYLSESGDKYSSVGEGVSLLCYCLMGNHFHLLLYQTGQGAMSKLMRGIMTSYSMYFNRKYNLSGALFESRYKASRISSDPYLLHISRYIHLNPANWLAYPYSSIHSYYLNAPDWLHPDRIIELFGSRAKYADFLNDYADYKESLTLFEDELANRIDQVSRG
jgi:putative transposase